MRPQFSVALTTRRGTMPRCETWLKSMCRARGEFRSPKKETPPKRGFYQDFGRRSSQTSPQTARSILPDPGVRTEPLGPGASVGPGPFLRWLPWRSWYVSSTSVAVTYKSLFNDASAYVIAGPIDRLIRRNRQLQPRCSPWGRLAFGLRLAALPACP